MVCFGRCWPDFPLSLLGQVMCGGPTARRPNAGILIRVLRTLNGGKKGRQPKTTSDEMKIVLTASALIVGAHIAAQSPAQADELCPSSVAFASQRIVKVVLPDDGGRCHQLASAWLAALPCPTGQSPDVPVKMQNPGAMPFDVLTNSCMPPARTTDAPQ